MKISECSAIRADYNKRDLRQRGEDAFMRCFTKRAPQQPSSAEATRQAEALLMAAMGRSP